MMIPEIEADLVAIARDEALLEEQSFVPRHPPHYLLPPEVRRRLPTPLPPLAVSPPSAHLPALRAASTLLLAAAEQPLLVTRASTLRRATLASAAACARHRVPPGA